VAENERLKREGKKGLKRQPKGPEPGRSIRIRIPIISMDLCNLVRQMIGHSDAIYARKASIETMTWKDISGSTLQWNRFRATIAKKASPGKTHWRDIFLWKGVERILCQTVVAVWMWEPLRHQLLLPQSRMNDTTKTNGEGASKIRSGSNNDIKAHQTVNGHVWEIACVLTYIYIHLIFSVSSSRYPFTSYLSIFSSIFRLTLSIYVFISFHFFFYFVLCHFSLGKRSNIKLGCLHLDLRGNRQEFEVSLE